MREWLLVAAGGAIGSVARYGLAGAIQSRSASGFPVGTLVVNVTGCFAIGVLMHVGIAHERATPLRLLLVTGVLGGYTTYSAFNYETLELVRAGQRDAAARARRGRRRPRARPRVHSDGLSRPRKPVTAVPGSSSR
jgi:CrcB protein